MNDPVNKPAHYTQGKVECIEALEAIGIALPFCIGNAIKYLWRCQAKGNTLQDLQKAQWYINRAVNIYSSGSVLSPGDLNQIIGNLNHEDYSSTLKHSVKAKPRKTR